MRLAPNAYRELHYYEWWRTYLKRESEWAILRG